MKLLSYAGILAAFIFAVSGAVFGALLDGFQHRELPVAVLGANGVPYAGWFNLFGWILPGVLVVIAAMQLRQQIKLDASAVQRIGTQMLLFSGLAFIAMGVLPIDVQDLDSQASRLHGTAWMMWWITFIAGVLLIWIGGLRASPLHQFVWFSFACGLLLVFCAFVLSAWVPMGIAQRMAFAVWFIYMAIAARVAHRAAH